MNLGKHSIRHPITTVMVMLAVVLVGAVSFLDLNIDLLPKISPPVAAVITRFPGASAQEVQDLVTIPVETVAATTPGIKDITSVSKEESSLVIVSFDWGKDMSEARADIGQRLEMITLPEDAQKPMTLEFDPNQAPIMQVVISNSSDEDLGDLTALVENEVKPRLESIEGVAAVDVMGGTKRRVNVTLDPAKLASCGLTQDQVAGMISASNLNYPMGTVSHGGLELQIRLQGRITSLQELEDLVVGYRMGVSGKAQPPTPVHLRDVAAVQEGHSKITSISRVNGKPGVSLAIRREGSANTVSVARAVRGEIDEISRDLKGLDATIALDQARFIEFVINTVQNNLLIGAGLAVLVLLLFLRDVRTTLVISISIPFSIIATFALMYFGHLTLNVMTLGGLALGIGMLVDNSIVVIENIFRHIQEGEEPRAAAEAATQEVAMAVTSSTLTTVVVFLPVVFVGGVTGIIFRELALTVTFSLLASLVVALTVVPMLASRWFGRRRGAHSSRPQSALGTTPGIPGAYSRLVSWSLGNKAVVFGVLLALMAGTAYVFPKIPTEFLPSADEGNFVISVRAKHGTPLTDIDQKMRDVERILNKEKDIEKYSVSIGRGDTAAGIMSGLVQDFDAQFAASLTEGALQERKTSQVMDSVKEKLEGVLSDDWRLTLNMTSSLTAVAGDMSSQVRVTVSGPDIGVVTSLSQELVTKMKDIKGLEDVKSSLSDEKPEVHLKVDREKALQHGLTPGQIALTVSRLVKGQTVTRYEVNGETLDVVIRHDPASVSTAEDIGEVRLQGRSGPVALKDIAVVEDGLGPLVISRTDKRLSAIVAASLQERSLGQVSADVQEAVDDLNIPDGYEASLSGMSEIMSEGFSELTKALILAALLVYMVMAASFESMGQPLIIMLTMPLAAIGTVAALYFAGYAFGITAFIGVIILAGVIVNNGIVMVDFINQSRAKGMPVREAIVQGASKRLRPVLMTSLTTIVGLVPMAMAVGEGSGAEAPLALSILGGLISGTFLTLVVIPVVYSIFVRDRSAKASQAGAPSMTSLQDGRGVPVMGTASGAVPAVPADASKEPQDVMISTQEAPVENKEELVLGQAFNSRDMAELIELLGKLFTSVRRKED